VAAADVQRAPVVGHGAGQFAELPVRAADVAERAAQPGPPPRLLVVQDGAARLTHFLVRVGQGVQHARLAGQVANGVGCRVSDGREDGVAVAHVHLDVEREHLVTRGDQVLREPAADETAAPGDEDPHGRRR